jgi:hypothetical protein
MSRDERVVHTWVKHQLRQTGRLEDYANWKLVVYARYCPEFNWVPIPEPPADTHQGLSRPGPDPVEEPVPGPDPSDLGR